MTLEGLRAALTRAGVGFLVDEPLARHTTLGVGGPVPLFVTPRDAVEVARAVGLLGEAALTWRALGAGSNLIADDEGLDFAVVATTALGSPARVDGTRVTAAGGVFLPRLAREAAEHGLAGLEFGIGIPGSVGGALRMNAGAWGSELSRVVEAVRAVRAEDGVAEERPFTPRFAYRTSGVDVATVVTEVVFRLEPGEPRAVLARIDALVAERRLAQPTAARSAGCAFRNPPGGKAGKLIEAAGLKGLSRGAAFVSERHANFLLNRGGACARDVLALLDEVRERVRDATGVALEREVEVWRGNEAGR